MHHRLFGALTAISLLFAAACASDAGAPEAPSPAPASTLTIEQEAAPGPYGVGVTTLDLVDTSRPTAANREYPGSPQRDIGVDVWYPAESQASTAEQRDAPPAMQDGPYPLIIFAHGYSSIRNQSASYLRHLASHGYVVAAPGFPSTRLDSPGGPRLFGVLDQPADVSFVIDELLARSTSSGSVLSGLIDGEHIGMTGHSGGGLTTMITAYGPLRDPRVDAAVPISPVGCLVPLDIAGDDVVPAMIIGGSEDLLVGPPSIRLAYDAASAPKYFIEIRGADHVRFGDFDTADTELGDVLSTASRGDITADAIRTAEGTGASAAACLAPDVKGLEIIPAEQQREILRGVALPFFDAFLKNNEEPRRFLDDALPTLDTITYEREQTNP